MASVPSRRQRQRLNQTRHSHTSSGVKDLQHHARLHLNDHEQVQLFTTIALYQTKHNVQQFIGQLQGILDTPAKRALLRQIRVLVPQREQVIFDKLLVLHRLWPPTASLPDSRSMSPVNATRVQPVAGNGSLRRHVTHPTTSQAPKPVRITIRLAESGSLGFDVRGGSEHGMPVFVSHVDEGSDAMDKGLAPGHLIQRVNGKSFDNITRTQAVKILTARDQRKLRLTVLPLNQVDGGADRQIVHYTWVDSSGRSASPPPEHKTGVNLLHPNAQLPTEGTRKVRIAKADNAVLGLSIRGGVEHGLGIYISAVERDSLAYIYGLQVGDQLTEVNGVSCLHIFHHEAAEMLKANELLIMRVRSVGKIPNRPIIPFDQIHSHTGSVKRSATISSPSPTSWFHFRKRKFNLRQFRAKSEGDEPMERFMTTSSKIFQHPESPKEEGGSLGKPSLLQQQSAVFKPGFGRQMMLKRFQQTGNQSARAMVVRQAQRALSADEIDTLTYYIDQYLERNLTVKQLVLALVTLFDTPEKRLLLSNVRTIIVPRDIDRYEQLVLPLEVQAIRDTRPADADTPTKERKTDDDTTNPTHKQLIDHTAFGVSSFGHSVDNVDGASLESSDESMRCLPSDSVHNSQLFSEVTFSARSDMSVDKAGLKTTEEHEYPDHEPRDVASSTPATSSVHINDQVESDKNEDEDGTVNGVTSPTKDKEDVKGAMVNPLLPSHLKVAEEEFGESPLLQRRVTPRLIQSIREGPEEDRIPVMTSTPLANGPSGPVVKTPFGNHTSNPAEVSPLGYHPADSIEEPSSSEEDNGPKQHDTTELLFQKSLVDRRNRIRPGSMRQVVLMKGRTQIVSLTPDETLAEEDETEWSDDETKQELQGELEAKDTRNETDGNHPTETKNVELLNNSSHHPEEEEEKVETSQPFEVVEKTSDDKSRSPSPPRADNSQDEKKDMQKGDEGERRHEEEEGEKRKAEEQPPSVHHTVTDSGDLYAIPEKPVANTSVSEAAQSLAGYDNLRGQVLTIQVEKVLPRLGMVVSGGANHVKHPLVTIRQVVDGGSAALCSELQLGMEILAVDGVSLKGKLHKAAVLTIKECFESPSPNLNLLVHIPPSS